MMWDDIKEILDEKLLDELDLFAHQQEETIETLTEDNTGDLDLEAVLRREPHIWRNEIITPEKKKKTILISDFDYFSLLEEFNKTRLSQPSTSADHPLELEWAFFRYLSEQGFEVCVWDDTTHCLNNPIKSFDDFSQKIEKLKTQLKQEKINPNKTHIQQQLSLFGKDPKSYLILNHKEKHILFSNLLKKAKEKEDDLNVETLSVYYHPEKIVFCPFLKKYGEELNQDELVLNDTQGTLIEIVNLQLLSEKWLKKFKTLCFEGNNWIGIKIPPDFINIRIINNKKLNEFISTLPPTLETLEISQSAARFLKIPASVKKLTLKEVAIDIEELDLSHCSQLEELHIENCPCLKKLVLPKAGKIKILNINRPAKGQFEIENLPEQTQLREIQIKHCDTILAKPYDEVFHFPDSLKKAIFEDVDAWLTLTGKETTLDFSSGDNLTEFERVNSAINFVANFKKLEFFEMTPRQYNIASNIVNADDLSPLRTAKHLIVPIEELKKIFAIDPAPTNQLSINKPLTNLSVIFTILPTRKEDYWHDPFAELPFKKIDVSADSNCTYSISYPFVGIKQFTMSTQGLIKDFSFAADGIQSLDFANCTEINTCTIEAKNGTLNFRAIKLPPNTKKLVLKGEELNAVDLSGLNNLEELVIEAERSIDNLRLPASIKMARISVRGRYGIFILDSIEHCKQLKKLEINVPHLMTKEVNYPYRLRTPENLEKLILHTENNVEVHLKAQLKKMLLHCDANGIINVRSDTLPLLRSVTLHERIFSPEILDLFNKEATSLQELTLIINNNNPIRRIPASVKKLVLHSTLIPPDINLDSTIFDNFQLEKIVLIVEGDHRKLKEKLKKLMGNKPIQLEFQTPPKKILLPPLPDMPLWRREGIIPIFNPKPHITIEEGTHNIAPDELATKGDTQIQQRENQRTSQQPSDMNAPSAAGGAGQPDLPSTDEQSSMEGGTQTQREKKQQPSDINAPSAAGGAGQPDLPSTNEQSSMEGDTQTQHDEKQLSARKIFDTDIPPLNFYRLAIFNEVRLENDTLRFDYVSNQSPIPIRPKSVGADETGFIKGSTELLFSSKKWTYLPSLFMWEEIRLPSSILENYEVVYFRERHQYAIKPKQSGIVNQRIGITWFVKSTLLEPSFGEAQTPSSLFQLSNFETIQHVLTQYPLLEKLKTVEDIVSYCQNFTEKPVVNDKSPAWLRPLLQQAGVCRHRAQACFLLCAWRGIPCRIVTNDVHQYIEIEKEGTWKQYDLGGVVANIATHPFKEEEITTPHSRMEEEQAALRLFLPEIDRDTFDSLDKTFNVLNQHGLLIRFQDPAASHEIALRLLQAHLSQPNADPRTFLYVDDPIQMQTLFESYAIGKDGKLYLVDGPLKQLIQGSGTLVVNWSKFSANQVATYKSVLDKVPTLHEAHVSSQLKIIGLEQTNCIKDDDSFYSRFTQILKIPEKIEQDLQAQSTLKALMTENASTAHSLPRVSLYEDARHWKGVLLGQPNVEQQQFAFTPGFIFEAIKQGGLIIENPPVDDPAMRSFLIDLKIKKEVWINGNYEKIPEPFEIQIENKPLITFQQEVTPLPLQQAPTQGVLEIHKNNFESLFHLAVINDAGWVSTQEGWLESSDYSHFIVSGDLTQSQWQRLLAGCSAHRKTFSVYPGVTVPASLGQLPENNLPLTPITFSSRIIFSEDPAYFARILQQQSKLKQNNVFYVNEKTTWSQLIEPLQIRQYNPLLLHRNESNLLQKLIRGETIVIHGKMDFTLYQRLSSLFNPQGYLLVNGKKIHPKGKIIFITPPSEHPLFKPAVLIDQRRTTLTLADYKKIMLEKNYRVGNVEKLMQLYEWIEKENIKHIPRQGQVMETILQQLDATESIIEKEKIIKSVLLIDFPHDSTTYKRINEKAKQLWGNGDKHTPTAPMFPIRSRTKYQKRVENFLKSNAQTVLILQGEPGVGKTHFVKELAQHDHTFWGKEAFLRWLRCDKPGNKILILDEYNLEDDAFYGLFENLKKGFVLYKDKTTQAEKIYRLTPKHKIICTCNPSYYPARKKQTVLPQQAITLYFKSPEEAELRALIQKESPGTSDEITSIFLAAYHHIRTTLPADQVSLRDLIMLCRYSKQLEKEFPNENKEGLAAFTCLAIFKDLFSDEKRKTNFENTFLEKINQQKQTIDLLKQKINQPTRLPPESSSYVLTPSRYAAWQMIFKSLSISRENPDGKSRSGMLLEGPSGIGKTQLYIEAMKAAGFKRNKDYYLITAGNTKRNEKLLRRAFKNGAIVILDELNLDPKIEKLLGHYLTGYDEYDQPPQKKGFFVLASQNPAFYGGRAPLSAALLNRLQRCCLIDYPLDELTTIARKTFLSKPYPNQERAEFLLQLFIKAYTQASTSQVYEINTRKFFQKLEKIKQAKTWDAVEMIMQGKTPLPAQMESEKLEEEQRQSPTPTSRDETSETTSTSLSQEETGTETSNAIIDETDSVSVIENQWLDDFMIRSETKIDSNSNDRKELQDTETKTLLQLRALCQEYLLHLNEEREKITSDKKIQEAERTIKTKQIDEKIQLTHQLRDATTSKEAFTKQLQDPTFLKTMTKHRDHPHFVAFLKAICVLTLGFGLVISVIALGIATKGKKISFWKTEFDRTKDKMDAVLKPVNPKTRH